MERTVFSSWHHESMFVGAWWIPFYGGEWPYNSGYMGPCPLQPSLWISLKIPKAEHLLGDVSHCSLDSLSSTPLEFFLSLSGSSNECKLLHSQIPDLSTRQYPFFVLQDLPSSLIITFISWPFLLQLLLTSDCVTFALETCSRNKPNNWSTLNQPCTSCFPNQTNTAFLLL